MPVCIFASVAIYTPLSSFATKINDTEKTSTNSSEVEKARSTVLLNRLTEIKKMDKSSLMPAEKKELRTELKSLKKEMKKSTQGVYLSVGAIIIIILLLILLL